MSCECNACRDPRLKPELLCHGVYRGLRDVPRPDAMDYPNTLFQRAMFADVKFVEGHPAYRRYFPAVGVFVDPSRAAKCQEGQTYELFTMSEGECMQIGNKVIQEGSRA